MQQIKLIICTIFILSFIPYSLMLKVSFKDGNIHIPLQEARMSTNLRLKFKTNKENGLLFLAAGRTDYCLLKLKSGKIQFHYKINNTLTKLSSTSRKFADMNWHDISVNRYDRNLSLQIDKIFLKETLPKNTNELNIHFGINLGGIGDMSADYLENITNFHGCIIDVFYNNINILKRAKEHSGYSNSGISWTCNNYFSYSVNDVMSFTNPNSYALIPMDSMNSNLKKIQFEFKTIQSNSMLLLNQGADTILIYINNGFINLYIDSDEKYFDLKINDIKVSNGKWHLINLEYNSTVGIFQLDEFYMESLNFDQEMNLIKNDQNFYIGGLPKDEQLLKSLKIFGNNQIINFNGCIKNIEINEQNVGFPNITNGNEILKDCLWNYTCLERNPCVWNSECKHLNLSDFLCKCDQPFCIRENYAEKYKIFTNDELELFEIKPIKLNKGVSIYLSTDYIKPKFNLSKLSNNDLIFYVTADPRYGELFKFTNNNQTIKNCNNFTLDDLINSRIKYVHNGIDNNNDRITIDLIINGINILEFSLISHQFRFLLYLNLFNSNSSEGDTSNSYDELLNVIQGIPKYLPKNFLNIQSNDYHDDIKYSIICPLNNSIERFGFQMDDKSVEQITQRQLNDEKITFYYISNEIQYDFTLNLTIQVIENKKINYTIYKPIFVHPLKLKLINNTGVVIIYETSELITNRNLSFIIEYHDDNDITEIRYNIERKPGFGFIERLKLNDATWEEIDWFTNTEINNGLIRYRSLTDKSNFDNFEFSVICGHFTSSIYEFKIKLTQLKIIKKELKDFIIKGSQKGTITNFLLDYGTMPLITPSKNVIYQINKSTKYGNIYLDGYPKHAKENDSFTQHDIDRNLVKYRTYEESYSKFTDYLELTILVDKCDDIDVQFKIIYYPVKDFSDNLHYQDQKIIKLKEGDKTILKPNNFDINLIEYKNLTFIIINQPKYGYIYKLGDSYKKISDFNSDELFSNKIHYQHDDSETETDILEILLLNYDKFQYNLQIQFKIELVNDNGPRKNFNTKFHVERNTKRLLTLQNLDYIDDDINTNTQSIYFLHISCNNGNFLLNEKITNRFSKFDIEMKKIYFEHNGIDKGQASFIISDGIHEIPGTLEIEASDPYILINQNNASLVKEGTYIILTKDNFKIETNIDVDTKFIKFTIIDQPKYGILIFAHENLTNIDKINRNNTIEQFTQFNIDNNEIIYWNTESSTMDKIRYQLQIKSVITVGHVDIRIYPAIYWEPLRIENNETLYVDESTSKPITKDVLQITHPSVSSGDIKFIITSLPMQGYIEIQTHSSLSSEEYNNINIFDQSAINSGNVIYIHAGVNGTLDSISFDVTNGITWLKNLSLRVVIIPEHFYVNTYPVYVNEGKHSEIKIENFIPYSEYYKSRLVEYKIIEPPKYGTVLMNNFQINRFTQKQLDSKLIRYANDGSEKIKDSITFVALARNKQSLPFTLDIFIKPVNDEQPMVTILNTFSVWRGGKYLIKNTDLLTEDKDSPPEDLKYIIDYVYGGYLVLADNNQKIHTFTQKQINDNEVYYVNDLNSTENEFGFLVTDGVFSTSHYVLKILIKPISILIKQNKNLIIFPMTYKAISIDELNYICSDELRDITFKLIQLPQYGTLFFKNEKKYAKNITKFTQNDILNGYIYYENTYFLSGLKMKDDFKFNAFIDNIEQLKDQIFEIDITISEGGLSKYIPTYPIYVNEGESNSINLNIDSVIEYIKGATNLNTIDLYFKCIEKPINGIVNNNNNNNIFYPINFKNQQVIYEHDNTETTDDKIIFSMYLLQDDLFLCNITVPVVITLVNDEPFELITKSPHIKLVEGENITITEDILCTKDNDTLPSDIIYDIISLPTIGNLVKIYENSNGIQEYHNISQFTQEDINKKKIIYIHDGPPKSTSFYFKVSDGSFSPVFEIFNITIEKIWFSLTDKQYEINLMQGYYSIVLIEPTKVYLTNINNNLLAYNITNSPESGIILIKNQPTLHFTHKNLVNKEITYMQTDINKYEDSFQINVYPSYGSYSYGITFNAIVHIEPIFKIRDLDMTSKAIQKFEITTLDMVTEQKYKLQNPKFLISKKPKYGNIKRKTTFDRNHSPTDEIIESFSLKDLRNGAAYYKLFSNDLDPTVLSDSFEYILQIRDTQPAKASVLIKLNENIKIENNRKEIFYIVLAIIVIIMIIISIIFIRTIIKHRNITLKNKHPPSLPKPPEMSGKAHSDSPDYLSRNTLRQLDGISYVPSCRVLVMDYNDDYGGGQTAEQCMINQKDNDNWSSSCDMTQNSDLKASQLSLEYTNNPLLRRNQYWV